MKPKVIIFGGCGFIGRNLVDELVREEIAEEVRVIDKVPPQTAWLNARHKASFDNPIVTFFSANLINPESCRAALFREDGEKWDWAVNCAGETKLGQSEAVYHDGIVKLSQTCAQQSALAQVRVFLEISCCMGNNKKIAHKESDDREPVTRIAQYKARVEEQLTQIPDLVSYVIRPAHVYGSGDTSSILPVLLLGSIYKKLGDVFRLLWSRDRKSNTVHVRDVCRAIVHVLTRAVTASPPTSVAQVYNVVDDSCSTQGSICDLVADIFGIEHGSIGNTISTIFKSDLDAVAEDANDKHLPIWAEMCQADGILNTPLSPYATADRLVKNHLFLDGSKLKSTGFQYLVPHITRQHLEEMLDDYISMNLFPKSALS